MTYSPPKYPTEIPTYATNVDDLPPWYDDLDTWTAAKANALRLELCACLSELGTLPKGSFSDVKTRLDKINIGCSLELLTNFSLVLEDETPLLLSYTNATTIFDPAAMHSMTTYPTRITVPYTGSYHVGYLLWYRNPDSHDGTIEPSIKINGSVYTLESMQFYINAGWQNSVVSGLLWLTANDYIEAVTYSEVGENAYYWGGRTHFWLHWLR